MIILLDLNYTLVGNSPKFGTVPPPMRKRMESEKYRKWLIEMVKPHYVILITARPDSWREATLARIQEQTGWSPQEAYFDEGITRTPPAIKRDILLTRIFPKHGRDSLLAIESNPKTRNMYFALGIPSVWVNRPGNSLRNASGLINGLPDDLLPSLFGSLE
jgi:hypothetical protein